MRKNLLKKIQYHDTGDEPVKGIDVLLALLENLLMEQYRFSSKRPFGNSDWYCYIGQILSGKNTTNDEKSDYVEDDGFDVDGFGGNAKYRKAVSSAIEHIRTCVVNYRKKDVENRIRDLESKIKSISDTCKID